METISSRSRWGDEHSSREKITLRHMEGLNRRRPFVRPVSTFLNRPRSTFFSFFQAGLCLHFEIQLELLRFGLFFFLSTGGDPLMTLYWSLSLKQKKAKNNSLEQSLKHYRMMNGFKRKFYLDGLPSPVSDSM